MEILGAICGGCLSMLGEHIADYTLNKLRVVPLETLQGNMESLRAKASEVEQQIKQAERSGRKNRKIDVVEWLDEVKSIETQVVDLGTRMETEVFFKRWMDGVKAAQLNEQVDKLVEKSLNFGELVIDRFGRMGVTLLTPRMVGSIYERNFKKILKVMENREVMSIGIYGMGGVGKTTLAKSIYNRLHEESPGHVFWVTVSQEFTIKSLQDKIGHHLNVDFLDEDEEEDMRAGRLYRALSDLKNAVLILDDVWEKIDMLKVGCPLSEECCRLIMTSRSYDVCHQIGCQEIIGVETLGEDEAWDLFNETLTVGKDIKLSPEVEEIATSMANFCDGLPLAVISLAASMRDQTAIHSWRNAFEKLKECFADQDGMREGRVFEVLKYSFDRLHVNSRSESEDLNSLQLCFLNMALYPEDSDVPRDELIGRFISEGLLDAKKSRRAQYEEGRAILDKLVLVPDFIRV